MPDYLNFELHILELEGGVYVARVLDAPQELSAEPPRHEFTVPYDARTLERIMLILSGERRPRGMSLSDAARQFGEAMFSAVFAGDVYAAYQEALNIAESRNTGLRIRLNLSRAGQLTNVPWEFLRDPQVDYLALSRATPLVRYTKQLVRKSRLHEQLPLRILVMISAPNDVPAVDEASERHNLERATIRLQQRGLVEIEYLEDASLRTLQRVLRQGEFHVFHYIGHSAFNAETGIGTLLLEDPYQHETSYPIRGEALARELHEEDTLRLVVLNSCQGAQSDARDPFGGIASSLVQRGIPAVVAQQFEITDRAAIVFSEEFYRAVAEGFPIEAAVAEGRRAIVSTLDNTEWATPVLFLYDNDSRRIFDFPSPDEVRRPLLRRLTSNERLPHVLTVLLGVIILILAVIFSGIIYGGDDAVAGFSPPTATPVPSVDLVVTDVRLSPRNPQPGDFVAVFVDVENRGADTSPPFTYEWQANIFDPASIVSVQVDSLAPGGMRRDTLNYRYGWWGVFISEARVDTQDAVIETAEQNSRPVPVRTDNTLPFVIDFNEPLPNGDFIRQNMPVPFGAFEAWGFRIETTASSNPGCVEAIPWFKFIGVSRVALGTGLPADPDQCTAVPLLIVFDEQRADNNPAGVSAIEVEFTPGSAGLVVQTFADPLGREFLDNAVFINRSPESVSVQSDPILTGFSRVFQVRVESRLTPLEITSITLSAP
jgi:hypothetical protein